MAAGSKFPLLLLPQKEILRTIRVMDLDQIFMFSLISKNCKDLVLFIKIKLTTFTIYIGSSILFSIGACPKQVNLSFYREPDMYWEMGPYGRKKKLTAPQSVRVQVLLKHDTTSYWPKNPLTIKEWLEHIQLIFNCKKINYIKFFDDSSRFDIDDIKEVFGNTKNVYIENTGCLIFNQMIIQKFFPIEKLDIKNSIFQNSKIPESILNQNFLSLHIGVTGENDTIKMTLDDLLLINSKIITIERLQMSPKDFNKFIKLWQKGANPQLEYLSIEYPNVEDYRDCDILMKGIKYRRNMNTSNMFQSAGLDKPEMLIGGMDIHRNDGTKATIGFGLDCWSMAVWMDHCIV